MSRTLAAVLAALAFAGCAPGPAAAQPRRAEREVDTARRRVYPALVNIMAVVRYYQGGRALRSPAGGSGVIVSPAGYVLTNYHVAGNSARLVCTLPGGEAYDARVVVHDPATDLSVLKLVTAGRARRAGALPHARLGDSSALRVGDPVIAMGNPLMLASSMTLGIVSNTRRVFTDFTGTQMEEMELEPGARSGMFTRWIQHDALILPGNSGGPLVNLRGEVVGINELGGGGVGFAIPSNTAARVLRQALARGRVVRGWLGLSVLPVAKMGRSTGALVSDVAPGSPARRAGLQPGDVLLSLGHGRTDVRFFEEVPALYQRIADLPVGARLPVHYLRGGRSRLATLAVAEMPPFREDEEAFATVGLTGRGITEEMMRSERLPTRLGVLVTGIRPGYPFDVATPRVGEGDIITAVDGRPVPGVEALRRALAARKAGEMLVAYRHGEETLVTVVRLEAGRPANEGGELPKAWLGAKTQVVTPAIATALHLGEGAHGFRVTQVYAGTEAARAGLRAGDIIVALNGDELQASRPQDSGDLRRAIDDLNLGETARLGVLRNGTRSEVSVVLQGEPAGASQMKSARQEEFEFTVRDIAPMDRMEQRWPQGQSGVLVSEVTTGGWAGMAGLDPDDLVLAINGRPVVDVAGFSRAMRAVMTARPRVVSLYVQRGYRTHFVFVEPDWKRIGSR